MDNFPRGLCFSKNHFNISETQLKHNIKYKISKFYQLLDNLHFVLLATIYYQSNQNLHKISTISIKKEKNISRMEDHLQQFPISADKKKRRKTNRRKH